MNAATAASIVFYEVFKLNRGIPSKLEPSREAIELLSEMFAELAALAGLPTHRRRLADRAFRNVLAKSVISRREVSLMVGVFRRIRDKTKPKARPAKRLRKVASRP